MGCLMLNGRECPAPKRLRAAPKPQFVIKGINVSSRKLNEKNSKLPPHSMRLSVDLRQLTTTEGIIKKETIPQSPKVNVCSLKFHLVVYTEQHLVKRKVVSDTQTRGSQPRCTSESPREPLKDTHVWIPIYIN